MVSLFQQNEPSPNSALQSDVVRENFEALFDKVRTLEVRAQAPTSTSVFVDGGAIYFRASSTRQLRLIIFNAKVLDFTQAIGFKTYKDSSGILFREPLASSGPSSFESEGLFLEVLVSLQPSGQLTFTEALAGQNNQLTSPFNIFFDDAEIPIALIILEKSADGTLLPIAQERVRDVRPFVTSAFQNNQQISLLESQVQDNTTRIIQAESALKTTDSLFTRLLSVAKQQDDDPTLTSNTKIEVFSGGALDDSGNLLKFGGALVDFSTSPSSTGFPVDPRTFSAGIGSLGLAANRWNRALISLEYDATITDPTENSKLVITHGTDAVAPDQIVAPLSPIGTIPLSSILYRMNTAGDNIIPMLTTQDIGGFRLSHQFPIVNLTPVPNSPDAFNIVEVDLSGTGFSQSFIETTLFNPTDAIELLDDNTRRIRRFIQLVSYNPTTEVVAITVTDSFTDISLTRTPTARSIIQHIEMIEDVRPFIGIS